MTELRWSRVLESTRLAAAVLAAGTLYGFAMHSINLPEEIFVYMAMGFGIGLVVGRWPIVAAGFAALSIGIAGPSADRTLWEIVCFVYLPAAGLSIAAGVAVRVLVPRVVRQWRG